MTSPEFKGAGHRVVSVVPVYADDGITPQADALREALGAVQELIGSGAALAVSTPGYGGPAEALFKMCLGNRIGVEVTDTFTAESVLGLAYGSFIVELADDATLPPLMESALPDRTVAPTASFSTVGSAPAPLELPS